MKLRSLLYGALAAVLIIPLLVSCGSTAQVPPVVVTPTTAVVPSATADAATPDTAGAQPTIAPTLIADTPGAEATATSADPAALTFPLKTPYLEFGVVTHLYYTDRERVLQLSENAGFDWVRQQIVWKDTEGPEAGKYSFDELDLIVPAVAKYKKKLLVNIVQAPSFYTADGSNGLPADPNSLANFVETLAKRYGNQIAAYEIWNEQNLAHETGGRIEESDVGKYVEMVISCYQRIKAVTPEAFVLIGAPSSSGVNDPSLAISDENYYRAMYAYKDGIIKDYFDAQGVHPGGAANPPDTLYPENPSFIEGCQPAPDKCWNDDATHYFRHIEDVRKIMEDAGLGDHQIWVTEFGWATPNDTPGYEFGNYVSIDQQAEYISGAMRLGFEKYQPWLGNMFLWNMNFAVLWAAQNPPQPNHEQASFGILNPDWSPRPSFNAVQALIAQVKQEEGR
jgi:hypothetical protein